MGRVPTKIEQIIPQVKNDPAKVEVVESTDSQTGKYSSEVRKPGKIAYWLVTDGNMIIEGETQPNQVTTSGLGKLVAFSDVIERDKFLTDLESSRKQQSSLRKELP